jgi:hypothetical protein
MSTDFWLNQSPWLPSNQGGAQGGGGGGNISGQPENVEYRDPVDASRSGAFARQGAAEYPDGYLNDTNSRRQARLSKDVMGRLTDRNYQRGVHAGVKMEPVQYFWPAEFYPEMRMQAEMAAHRVGDTIPVPRFAPVGNPFEKLAHGARMQDLSAQEQTQVQARYGINPAQYGTNDTPDPTRFEDLPRWKW